MDIKDFILIGGGILIALVVGHGFWIAWRAKREPLRLDIVPDLIPSDVDDMERLRGELPNGGARVVSGGVRRSPEQVSLELEEPTPVLMDPAPAEPARDPQPQANVTKSTTSPVEPEFELVAQVDGQDPEPARAQVREVQVSSAEPAIVAEPANPPPRQKRLKPKRHVTAENNVVEVVPVEELLVINVLASKGSAFAGEDLINALRGQGLRFGDMSIFHRVDPATKAKLYSVANAVEPGTFDMAEVEALRSPGITFFLQLPGPDDALAVFEDMVRSTKQISRELNGEVRDEQMSILSGQTVEHMRQRIADFARRRLSKRA